MSEPWPRKRWTCPHCGKADTPASCARCGRAMCEDCISVWPELGQVCGLCLDRLGATECKECGAVLPSVGYRDGYCDKCGG